MLNEEAKFLIRDPYDQSVSGAHRNYILLFAFFSSRQNLVKFADNFCNNLPGRMTDGPTNQPWWSKKLGKNVFPRDYLLSDVQCKM